MTDRGASILVEISSRRVSSLPISRCNQPTARRGARLCSQPPHACQIAPRGALGSLRRSSSTSACGEPKWFAGRAICSRELAQPSEVSIHGSAYDGCGPSPIHRLTGACGEKGLAQAHLCCGRRRVALLLVSGAPPPMRVPGVELSTAPLAGGPPPRRSRGGRCLAKLRRWGRRPSRCHSAPCCIPHLRFGTRMWGCGRGLVAHVWVSGSSPSGRTPIPCCSW